MASAPPALAASPADKPLLSVRLAAPRGFCAGVDRAIAMVERALQKYGAPVYVRHEIVHNTHVVAQLAAKGAVFVDELSDCPDGRPVIFSAHGVPKCVPERARDRGLFYLDATCPLVSKVHLDAERHFEAGREIVLIGHAGHPEVVGTLGQLPNGAITLLETVEDARAFQPKDPANLAFITQTTLSLDDTSAVVAVLQARFPQMAGPHGKDICYATTNRQEAVKGFAPACDLVLVLGSAASSNSVRLVETARRAGARAARLIEDAEALDLAWLEGVKTLGLTAGASAPEALVKGVLDRLAGLFTLNIEEGDRVREAVTFKLPRVLAS